jgi:hypothetical protein
MLHVKARTHQNLEDVFPVIGAGVARRQVVFKLWRQMYKTE